jgi:general nucleoside transport system permease protein
VNPVDLLAIPVIVAILAAGVRMAIPLLLASLGELINERSGVLNMGVEGVMMCGALGGFVGSSLSHSPWVGALLGLVAGAAAGLIIAVLCVTMYANQAIVGVIFNLLAQGLTGFMFRAIYGIRTTQAPPKAIPFDNLDIPVLSQIPVLGQVLFSHPPLVYLAVLLVPLTVFLLWRTRFGLEVRTVGGYAKAADTMGIDVYRVRYLALLLGSALAGLGGAFLTVQLGVYRDGMTSGRGYIAIAIVTFARWNPWAVLGGALLFGVADSLQLYLQAFGFKIPYQFLLMLPYVLTVIVLTLRSSRVIPPSVLAEPYIRDRKLGTPSRTKTTLSLKGSQDGQAV